MKTHNRISVNGFFRDEEGITTTAMAISIMVSLALIFSGAQAYKATSESAEIQEVADACALAAESEVADFMVCVKVCDAVVLSLSLLAATTYGLGIVCACVPPLKALSNSLSSIGNKTVKARNDFSQKASNGLNKLQNALPFFAAAAASSIATANGKGASKSSYLGCAILLPKKGEQIKVGKSDDLDKCTQGIDDKLDDIQKKAEEAEKAAKEVQKAKEDAYMLDCGNSPGYCQYERAGRFSWMPASENPFYSSVDAWSFSVALKRAKSYYAYREGCEAEPEGSVKDKSSYFVRMKFYSYAYEKLESEGYVTENDSSFSANFPKLYRNTSEFRQTSLYTSALFPVTSAEGEELEIMHAWSGCPDAIVIDGYDTISALDSGAYTGCTTCGFSVESLGNVASASTNISNGFEYHYERIRQLAEKYQEASSKADPLTNEVKSLVEPLFDSLADFLKEIGNYRISANPCGSIGALALVVNKSPSSVDSGFESMFVKSPGSLGTRMAVSGASLVEDDSEGSGDIICNLLGGFEEDGGSAIGGARIALDCWSGLLRAYENGQSALKKTVSDALSVLSLGTMTGIGDWAGETFDKAISDVGLEPANTNVQKPAILNTGHLVDASTDTFAINYRKKRTKALSLSSSTGNLFDGLGNLINTELDDWTKEDMTIAEIEFPVGDSTIPIKIEIPDSAKDGAENAISKCVRSFEDLIASSSKRRVWQ